MGVETHIHTSQIETERILPPIPLTVHDTFIKINDALGQKENLKYLKILYPVIIIQFN